jgi:hypothetical protein
VNDVVYRQFEMGCEYFPDEELAHWVWYDPEANDTQRFDVPQCWPRCPGKPPVIANTMKNWTKSVYIFYMRLVQCGSKYCFVVTVVLVVVLLGTAFSTNLLSFQLLSILCHCMQPCLAALPGSLARQPCPAALPGSLARQPCPAALHKYYKFNNRLAELQASKNMKPVHVKTQNVFSLFSFGLEIHLIIGVSTRRKLFFKPQKLQDINLLKLNVSIMDP